MLDVQADLGGLVTPVIVAALLAVGAWSAVRTADERPRRGRHRATGRRAPVAQRKRPRPVVPVPVSGGAAGLLESIPRLEPVRRRRLRGTARLGTALLISAALVASALFMLGRAFVNWLSQYQP